MQHSREVHNRYEKIFPATLWCSVGLILMGFLMDPPREILHGLYKILTMQDLLIMHPLS